MTKIGRAQTILLTAWLALSTTLPPASVALASPNESENQVRLGAVPITTSGVGTRPALSPPRVGQRETAHPGAFSSVNIEIGRRFASGSAATPDGTIVYVMNNDSTISVVDAVHNQFVKTIDFTAYGVGVTSGGVVVDDKLYVVGSSHVIVMDVGTETVVSTIPQSASGGVLWGRAVYSQPEQRVYTVCGACATMLAINTTTYQLAGQVTIGGEHTGIGISPSRHRIYISDRVAGQLTIIDSQTLTVLSTSSYVSDGGILPYTTSVAIGLDGTVYVGYVDSSFNFRVAILGSDGSLKDTLVLTGFSTGLDISRDGLLLVTGDGRIIATPTYQVVADVDTGVGEFQVNFAPDGLRAYITNYNSTFITEINGFTPRDRLGTVQVQMAFQQGTLNARVRVADLDRRVVVPGATVQVTLDLPDGQTILSSVTNSTGWATFQAPTAGGGTCQLTVDNVTRAGLVFDSNNSILHKAISCR